MKAKVLVPRHDSEMSVHVCIREGEYFSFVDEMPPGAPSCPHTLQDAGDEEEARAYAEYLCRRYGFTTVSFEYRVKLAFDTHEVTP
jgi:hypothetical protein